MPALRSTRSRRTGSRTRMPSRSAPRSRSPCTATPRARPWSRSIGLLIPLNTMFSGLSVIVDREAGAQRELLAAPIRRGLLPLGNLIVAFGVTAFQIAVLLGFARARGIHFHATATGWLWFLAAGS